MPFEAYEQTKCAQLHVEKIGRAMMVRQLEDDELGPQLPHGRPIVGRVESDGDAETWGPRVPMVVIDGRSISWMEFGRMWTSYEGWHFRLVMIDKTEEG